LDRLADRIRDPKSHNPKTIMPAYAARLSQVQLEALADYLAALR
jgi:cytochrome c553